MSPLVSHGLRSLPLAGPLLLPSEYIEGGRMGTRFCDECKVIPAKFALRKGEEVSYLCEPSFKEVLLDLVTTNDTVIFAEVGDMKARSLVSNAILWKHLGPQRANPPGHGPLALSAGAWLPLPERDFSESEGEGEMSARSRRTALCQPSPSHRSG
jgi:hypothetical protein